MNTGRKVKILASGQQTFIYKDGNIYSLQKEPKLIKEGTEFKDWAATHDGTCITINTSGNIEFVTPASSTSFLRDLKAEGVFQRAVCSNMSICLLDENFETWFLGSITYNFSFQDSLTKYSFSSVPIVNIFCGEDNLYFMDKDSKLWGVGLNNSGCLGLGHSNYQDSPKIIEGLSEVVEVACGVHHCLILDKNGFVYGAGGNDYGQIGLGEIPEVHYFQKLETLSNIINIAAGSIHSLCLSQEGDVYAFGCGGMLGTGEKQEEHLPRKINLAGIVSVHAGTEHSFCVDNNGAIWAFGFNTVNQLGLPDRPRKQKVPIIISL